METDPGYFQFDDIIQELPAVYDAFALSTMGLVERLRGSGDLDGSTLADICAGTGRCALTLTSSVRQVYAVELQRGPSLFAREQIKARGLMNVTYVRGDANALPLRSRSVDLWRRNRPKCPREDASRFAWRSVCFPKKRACRAVECSLSLTGKSRATVLRSWVVAVGQRPFFRPGRQCSALACGSNNDQSRRDFRSAR